MPSIDMSEYPPEIQGPSAWYGPKLDAHRDWIEVLSDTEITEIERATQYIIERLENPERDLVTLRKQDFPLPSLAPRLERIVDEVLTGRGFVLIRRLPVERWSALQRGVAFCGLGIHCGNLRSQNADGHVLGHVKDLGDPDSPRLYKTNKRQGYHTDSCDIVGLLCLNTAKEGGLSSLVSSVTLFNEFRRRRPDLLPCLFAPIETDRRGEVPEGQKPYFGIPVFNWHAGFLSAIYQRKYIDEARKLPGVPPYTKQQVEALDLLDQLVDDPTLHLRMEFQPGDVQLVHNHTLWHDRTSFVDWPEPQRKRHLLRLWLAPPGARPLPEVFAERYGSITPGDRGGVSVRGTILVAPLDVTGQQKLS
jgi:Taurine catabolism dioxygenase TauD, TfdA family